MDDISDGRTISSAEIDDETASESGTVDGGIESFMEDDQIPDPDRVIIEDEIDNADEKIEGRTLKEDNDEFNRNYRNAEDGLWDSRGERAVLSTVPEDNDVIFDYSADSRKKELVQPDDSRHGELDTELSNEEEQPTLTYSEIEIAVADYPPPAGGAEEGHAWLLVDEGPNEETKLQSTSHIIHRKNGDGAAYPWVVRSSIPEIFSDPTETTVSETEPTGTSDEVITRIGYDGQEVQLMRQYTQTDWNWVEDMICSNMPGLISVNIVRNVQHHPPVTSHKKEQKNTDGSRKKATDKDEKKKDEKKGEKIKAEKGKGDKKKGDKKKGDKKMKTETLEDVTSPYSLTSKASITHTSEPSSDSDTDDDILSPSHITDGLIPSVGPPDILRYIPESEEINPEVRDALSLNDASTLKCEFCHEQLLPFPTVEQQTYDPPETLYCCEAYRNFVETAMEQEHRLEEAASSKSLIIDVKPHAHYGSAGARKLARDRAQQRQQERVVLKHIRSQNLPTTMLSQVGSTASSSLKSSNSTPRKASQLPQLGSSTGLLANAGQAPLTQRSTGPQGVYKDLERTPVGASQHNSTFTQNDLEPSLFRSQHDAAVGRQMKTINFQLSSQRCMDEGWTLPTAQGLMSDGEDDDDIFMPLPLKEGVQPKQVHKTYENGSTFLMMFEDGSGTVLYPSGQPAITIMPVARSQFFYIVQSDDLKSEVLGIFDPSAIGTCCYSNGHVRLTYDALGGSEYNAEGDRKRVWRWHELEPHIHAPPLQPITLTLNPQIHIRILTQDNILLTFRCAKRNCCFNVGTKVKVLLPQQIQSKEIDPIKLDLDDISVHIQMILDKVNNITRYSRSLRAERILPPLYLTRKSDRVNRLKQQLPEKSLANKDKLPQISIVVT